MRRRLQGKMPPIPIHTTPYAVSVEPSNLSNSDSTIISVEAETQNSLNTPKRFAYSELGRRPCGGTDSLNDSSCPLCPISYTSVLPQIEPTQIVTLVASPNAAQFVDVVALNCLLFRVILARRKGSSLLALDPREAFVRSVSGVSPTAWTVSPGSVDVMSREEENRSLYLP